MRKENLLGDTERECLENGEKGAVLNQQSSVCVCVCVCVCVFDQARAIRKNGWLLELELEAVKRQIENESQGEFCREQDVAVDAETVETDAGTVEEEINDAEDSIGDTEGDLSEEHRAIVEQFKKKWWKEGQAMTLCLRKWAKRY